MKKILFATTNPAKIKFYAEELKRKNIEVLTLRDLDINITVEENGKTAIENAIIKANAYNKASNMITVAIDDTLFIEGIPEALQPGTNVRRVNGKTLTDDEMIEYYTKLSNQFGGKLIAKWVKGTAINNGNEIKTFLYEREDFYLVDLPSKIITKGYPLDSITIIPKLNRYLSEIKNDDIKIDTKNITDSKICEFIINNI